MLSILFICSGNTCRSPMAETVAKSWLSKHFDPKHFKVSSTGTHAKMNKAVSPEAVIALARHNIPHHGKSKQLTIDLITEHDLVFVMTKQHLKHIQEMIVQNKTDKTPIIKTLHPDRDIVDPLGKGQRSYDELADEFVELIPLQLKPFMSLLAL
jgi:protein-tyrosine phosphatase